MPTRTAVAQTLEAWRDAERLLLELPPIDPDHETVQLLVVGLRATYEELTSRSEMTAATIAASQASVADARRLVARIRGDRLTD